MCQKLNHPLAQQKQIPMRLALDNNIIILTHYFLYPNTKKSFFEDMIILQNGNLLGNSTKPTSNNLSQLWYEKINVCTLHASKPIIWQSSNGQSSNFVASFVFNWSTPSVGMVWLSTQKGGDILAPKILLH